MRIAALMAICLLFLAALALFEFRNHRAEDWPEARGVIQGTRIVPDHAIETRWGGNVTWKAEYKVAYSVSSGEFTVWADSGIRGESEADIRMNLLQSRPVCRVRYKPQSPEVSVADCK